LLRRTPKSASDAAYASPEHGRRGKAFTSKRAAFLFELYHKYTSLLPALEVAKIRRKKEVNSLWQRTKAVSFAGILKTYLATKLSGPGLEFGKVEK
jgi:hypothetical protein